MTQGIESERKVLADKEKINESWSLPIHVSRFASGFDKANDKQLSWVRYFYLKTHWSINEPLLDILFKLR